MFLIDNNLSPRLARALRPIYPGIQHVESRSLDFVDDISIWEFAVKHQLHILTKDADFSAIQQMKGFPPKIIWIKTGNCTTKYILELLQDKAVEIKQFLANPHLGLLEIS